MCQVQWKEINPARELKRLFKKTSRTIFSVNIVSKRERHFSCKAALHYFFFNLVYLPARRENQREYKGTVWEFLRLLYSKLSGCTQECGIHHYSLRPQQIFSSLDNCHIVPFECFYKSKQW